MYNSYVLRRGDMCLNLVYHQAHTLRPDICLLSIYLYKTLCFDLKKFKNTFPCFTRFPISLIHFHMVPKSVTITLHMNI